MALFDIDIPLSYETSLEPVGSRELTVFDDLTYHIESLTDDEIIAGGLIVCRPLTDTEKTTVMSFYDTNKNIVFTFTDPNDDETYSLYFISPPPKPKKIESMIGHWEIRLSVAGVKQVIR